MIKDRGMIKWAPFNAVINNKYVINNLVQEKSKTYMPILSNDEINDLEINILNAYYSKTLVTISYYQNGYVLKIKSKIKKIDKVYKLIYLDNTKLFFKQIISINYI